MFKCDAGHISEPGDSRILITSKIRETFNIHTIRYPNDKDKRVEGRGFEIVEVAAYCPDHAQEVKPQIVNLGNPVKRTAIFKGRVSNDRIRRAASQD